jgi:hypothetical protein
MTEETVGGVSGAGAELGTGEASLSQGQEQEPQGFTEAQLRQLETLIAPRVAQARDEGMREMQSNKDRELSQRERHYQRQLDATKEAFGSKFRELGASDEDLQRLTSTVDEQVQELSKDDELQQWRAWGAYKQQQEQLAQRFDGVLDSVGIPKDTPGLNLQGSEQEFFASVATVLQQRLGSGSTRDVRDPADAADDTLEQPPSRSTRVETGAADVVSGGTARAPVRTEPREFRDADDYLKQGLGVTRRR